MLSTVGIFVDIIIIAAIVINAIIGLKKGLMQTLLSIFSWGVCIVIAILTAKYVAGWINGIYDFSNLIGKSISKNLIKSNNFFSQAINVYQTSGKDALIAAIPNNVNKLLAKLIGIVFNNSDVNMASTKSIGSVVGASLGDICMIIIAGILVFIILKIIVALLSKLFKNLERIKVIGGLNKVLGLVIGALKALFIIVVINIVIVGLSLVPTVNKTITPIINENTKIEKFVYKQTDKLFEKYVIEGDVIGKTVENLWKSR